MEIVHKLYSNIVLTLYGMIRIVCACLTALGLGYGGKVLEGGNNVFTFFRRHFHILNLGVCGEENGVLSAAHLLCLQGPTDATNIYLSGQLIHCCTFPIQKTIMPTRQKIEKHTTLK